MNELRRASAGERPLFLALLGFQLILLVHLALGMTIWYDEAWRVSFASARSTASEMLGMLFVDGWPLHVSGVYLLLCRAIHLFFGYPWSDLLLRGVSILCFMTTVVLLWRFLREIRTAAVGVLVASSCLILNPLAAYHAVAIKEHVIVGLLAFIFFAGLVRALSGQLPIAWPAVVGILLANLISPLGLPPLAAALFFLGGAWLTGRRSFALDRRLVMTALGLVLPLTAARSLGMAAMTSNLQDFFHRHGVVLQVQEVFGASPTTFGHFVSLVAELAGLSLVPPVGRSLGLLLFLTLVVTGAWRRYRSSGLFALACLGGSILFFQLGAGVSHVRFFLWVLPILCFFIGHAFAAEPGWRRVALLLSAAAFLLLSGAECARLLHYFPEKRRSDRIIFHRGPRSFDATRDVVLHIDGLTFYHHDVVAPEIAKGVLPTPEFGAGSLMLHPDCPSVPRALPHHLWTDTRLEEFHGGTLWVWESWRRTPAVRARLLHHAFGGRAVIEDFEDFPTFWMRVSAPPEVAGRSASNLTG